MGKMFLLQKNGMRSVTCHLCNTAVCKEREIIVINCPEAKIRGMESEAKTFAQLFKQFLYVKKYYY